MSVTAPLPSTRESSAPLSRWTSRAPDRLSPAKLAMTTAGSVAVLVFLVLLGTLSGHLLLIPPMAASMALVAAAPQSPLAQPRSVIGGQFVAALVGVGTGFVSHSMWAAAIAGGLTIGATLWLRMPHSPAAATAVIGTLAVTGQVSFVACCVVAACILVLFGLLRSRIQGGTYPTYWI